MKGGLATGALLAAAANAIGAEPLRQAMRSGIKDARNSGGGNASNPRGAARREAKGIVGARQLRKMEKAARRQGGAS